MAVSIDQQFIEYIIKSVVGHPDDVKIERRIDEKGVLLELSVNPEDLGRVIGKRGATAQSLRTLLRALGTKNDARYNLKIIDTDSTGSRQAGPSPSYAKASEGKPEGREPRTAVESEKTSTAKADDARSQSGDQAAPSKPVPADDFTPADVPADGPATSTAADDIDMSDDIESDLSSEALAKEEDHSDVVSRTRKELADLDDLDV